MKFLAALLALIALNFAPSAVGEENCNYTFRCQGNICERVPVSTCPPTPPNVVIHVTPSTTPIIGAATDATSNQIVAPSSGISKNQETPQTPSNVIGCAENGSCYGDVSNITGLPKTVPVQGYYRKDGTYVRGYYRSHK